MREDQYVGLTPRAEKWLEANVMQVEWTTTTRYSDGRVELHRGWEFVSEQYGVIEGAWTPVVHGLARYTLKDGTQVEEFVQAEPWSSGPMYFIGLRPSIPGVGPLSWPHDLNWEDEEIREEL